MKIWLVAVLAVFALAVAVAAVSMAAPAEGSACASENVQAKVAAFVTAFNRGDLAALDGLFAHAPDFAWYSSNPPGLRNNAGSKRRDTLLAYFRDRHAHHDRLRMVSLRLNSREGGRLNFDFRMQRSANDYAGGAWFPIVGKGVLLCDGTTPETFTVMSVGGDQSCPVTFATAPRGGGPALSAASFNYGTAKLRAQLHWWKRGELLAGILPDGGAAATIADDGSVRTKLGWWRGEPGNVRITIRAYNRSAPTTQTRGPDGYGVTGFQPSVLTFPGAGCWQVTGKVGQSQISFVVRVSKIRG